MNHGPVAADTQNRCTLCSTPLKGCTAEGASVLVRSMPSKAQGAALEVHNASLWMSSSAGLTCSSRDCRLCAPRRPTEAPRKLWSAPCLVTRAPWCFRCALTDAATRIEQGEMRPARLRKQHLSSTHVDHERDRHLGPKWYTSGTLQVPVTVRCRVPLCRTAIDLVEDTSCAPCLNHDTPATVAHPTTQRSRTRP